MWNALNFEDVLIEFDGVLFLLCCINIIFQIDIVFIVSCNIGDHCELCLSPFMLCSTFNTISVISPSILFSFFSSFDVNFFIFVHFLHVILYYLFKSVFPTAFCNILLLWENWIVFFVRMVMFLRLCCFSLLYPS